MKLKIYQVDAFTEKVFSGNPAAIVPLESWLEDAILQKIAMENNLAETGFYVPKEDHFEIKWFTPTVEVDLCGHATLAAAHVLFDHEGYTQKDIRFLSHRSGQLKVSKEGELLTLDFPSDVMKEIENSKEVSNTLKVSPLEVYKGKTDYMVVLNKESEVVNYQPDFSDIMKLKDCRGLIITAKGDQVDFVSRFFAPQSGINEDPVTGSAHTSLTPYWAKKLGKKTLSAIQLSERIGHLTCTFNGDRVNISGNAVTYLIGEITI